MGLGEWRHPPRMGKPRVVLTLPDNHRRPNTMGA